YLFQPRSLPIELQNRAIALSYYATASLSQIPLLLVMVVCWPILGILAYSGFESYVVAAAGALVLGGISYWLLLGRLARRVLRAGWLVWRVRVLTPVLWVVGGGLAFVVPAFVVFYLWLIAGSLL